MKNFLFPLVILFCHEISLGQDTKCKEDKTFENISDTRINPYGKYCHIYVTRKKFIGKKINKSTGVVIAPNAILTAGHSVWNPRNRIIRIKIVPAENGKEAPFGVITYDITQIKFIQSSPAYTGKTGQVDADYGIIVFSDTKVSDLTGGFIPIRNFDSLKNKIDTLSLAGYPTNHKSQMILRKANFNRFQEEDQKLYYDIYTGKGDSGAALITEVGGEYFVVGIHNNGNLKINKCNGGTKINSVVYNQITKWLLEH